MLSPEDISNFWSKLSNFVFSQAPVVIFMLASTVVSLLLWMRGEDKNDILRQALGDCFKEKAAILEEEGKKREAMYEQMLRNSKKDTIE